MAKSFSAMTALIFPCDISNSKASLTKATAAEVSSAAIPTQIECSEEAWVISTTLIFALERTSKNLLDIPGIPTIPEPSNEIKAMFSTWLMPCTVLFPSEACF